MTNEGVETLPATELDHFLSIEILYEQTRRKHEQEPATISNFQPRIVQNEKKRRTVIERDKEEMTFKTASSLAVHMPV